MIQGKHIIEPTDVLTTGIRTEYTFEVDIDARLSEIFNLIPNNSIINKGRCGIGGTYLELKAERNSIIIVPTNAIIDNKCFDEKGNIKDGYYVVRGKTKYFKSSKLKQFMQDQTKHKKIFCTPESLSKIIKCGYNLDELHNEWFILFDEAHTVITDAYRKNMLIVFNYFFEFANKAMISATPYKFSAPQLEAFTRYKIGFTSKVGKVEIISTTNVNARLYQFLKDPERLPHRVHIFLNSVNGIAEIIRMASVTDCSVFCKDDKDNMRKLDELKSYFKANPCEETFSKFNFYTTKYFEGWDLYDENATMIVVSDVNNITLRTGISNKCVQAMGRNRKKSNRLVHLTNDYNIPTFEQFENLAKGVFKTAYATITNYQAYLAQSEVESFNPDKDVLNSVEKYCDLEGNGYQVRLNYFNVDRLINRDYCEQEYNSVDFIKQAWEKSHYLPIIAKRHVKDIPQIDKRKKETYKVQVIAEFLENLNNPLISAEDYSFTIKELQVDFEDIIEYYYELGISIMRQYNFEPILLREAYRKSRNSKALSKVADEYFEKFEYTEVLTAEVSDYLQKLYADNNVIKEKGAPIILQIASASKLKSLFTKVTPTKNESKQHVWRIDIK